MKKTIIYILASLFTLGAAFYQRASGPTHPQKIVYSYQNQDYKVNLPRTSILEDVPIHLKLDAANKDSLDASVFYRIYPPLEGEGFTRLPMQVDENGLVAYLPQQAVAGKLEYYIQLDAKTYFEAEPLIIRFKGDVPAPILIPHILLMFAAMFFAIAAALFALKKDDVYKLYARLCLLSIAIGGFVFGAIVQKYAFGAYWTGFPFGYDLTDNKTLIAFLAILLAVIMIRYIPKFSRIMVVFSSIIIIAVFCIPHSMRGSQLNRTSGKVETQLNK